MLYFWYLQDFAAVDISPSYRCFWADVGISPCYERTACNFHCIVTSGKLLFYVTIKEFRMCFAKFATICATTESSLGITNCFFDNPDLLPINPCSRWLSCDCICMLLLMFQANLHLQIHGYLLSLKLLDSEWLFLVFILLLVVSSPISPIFSRSYLAEFCRMTF